MNIRFDNLLIHSFIRNEIDMLYKHPHGSPLRLKNDFIIKFIARNSLNIIFAADSTISPEKYQFY